MFLARLQRFNRNDISPLHHVLALGDELDRWFRQALAQPADARRPALDLFEDKDTVVVKIELPGLKKEDIAIDLNDGVLTVSSTRQAEVKHAQAKVLRRETSPGQFARSVSLPYPVDAEKTKAAYTDGLLTITLPKAEEAKPKQIPIDIK
jgi:HSP20 family protein